MKNVNIDGNSVVVTLLHYRNGHGEIVIPGSSFKGAVSTNFLALSGSIEDTSNLFGATKNAVISKVFFSDLKPVNGVEPVKAEVLWQWSPRKFKRNHVKFYVKKASRTQKFGYAECIPKGMILTGEIVGYNLKDYEIGGLLASLGYSFDGVFKIGYAKPQGFGQMKLVGVDVYEVVMNGFTFEKRKLDEKERFVKSFEKFCRKRGRNIAEIAEKVFAEVV
jgi:CRISPR/Cas system CSM-associated protein Csm3 (group 7 of RAMP superfamily)